MNFIIIVYWWSLGLLDNRASVQVCKLVLERSKKARLNKVAIRDDMADATRL
jgi:hypothetical protein